MRAEVRRWRAVSRLRRGYALEGAHMSLDLSLTLLGMLLLVPFTITTQVGALVRNENIPPHRKPRIAFSPTGIAILNVVWVLLLVATTGLLIAGSGWWTLLLFPGGMVAVGVVIGVLGRRGGSRG